LVYDFDWNPIKAKINRQKHGVSFELAITVFKDPRALSVYDDEHSDNEERWITLGIAENSTVLVVNHTFEEVDATTTVIRIFSCRKAQRN
jgi:uncharacterized DUF497 family protein